MIQPLADLGGFGARADAAEMSRLQCANAARRWHLQDRRLPKFSPCASRVSLAAAATGEVAWRGSRQSWRVRRWWKCSDIAAPHDIRVGIASGMFLKTFVPDRSRRIEMLMMLYPAYWRWSTRDLVIAMHEHREELTVPGASVASRRADIYAAAWDKVEATMRDKQVVGYRDEQRVALLHRSKARRITCCAEGRFGYHPISNPASRRTGASDARILFPDVRSGKL